MGWIQGSKLVAVAIVAQAIWDMSKKLIPSVVHLIIAILALLTLQFWGNPFAQVTVIALAALIGARLFKQTNGVDDTAQKNLPISKTTGGLLLALFAMLMIALPIANSFVKDDLLTIIEKCYLAGALVFGGGHVVLPLLETQFVQSGLMSASDFIAGYGLTQAVPWVHCSHLLLILGWSLLACQEQWLQRLQFSYLHFF
ncbi:ChrA protein OS=Lysinibacillus sphaericus OX=1421 GN=LS41612_07930 PE=3 SV=1 [Lysinibacillus sphaericus]